MPISKKRDPLVVLKSDRNNAVRMAQEAGAKRTLATLRRAQNELNQRLRRAEGLRGIGADTFSATQMRVTLEQIRNAIEQVKDGMRETVVDTGTRSATFAAESTINYIQRADQKFTGIAGRLGLTEARVMDRAVKGTESSILNRLIGDEKAGPGILERYGDNVIKKFEGILQQRFIQKTPWSDVRNQLIAESDFLQGAPMSWAERIVRTEVMAAHNRASWEGLRAVNAQVGGQMLKILSATFDDRTSADSYAVHGQIRKPEEAFEDWNHQYQHPPNRPNDRETVVPHNINWPIPDALRWRTDGEVSSRWIQEGRKGSPPSRPNMTTVPLDKIGNQA
jgi:hypothetical protein